MHKFYNHIVFLLYLGGVFSLALTVAVVFLRQIHKRSIEKKRLEQIMNFKPEEVGDIDAKLDDSFEFRFPALMQEIAIWGIQPLFIICFVNLFSIAGETEICIAFTLVIITLFHEFYLSDKYSKKKFYQILVIALWLITFLIFSYRTNISEEAKSINSSNVKLTAGL